MGMQINTNVAALNSYRNLSNTQNDLSKSLEKLSSGLRINRAADDAAGLAISEGLRSQVGGLKVAARNAQDGISVIQTTEGGLTSVQSILQRMRDLAVQAGNDSNNADSRKAITTEATFANASLISPSITSFPALSILVLLKHQTLSWSDERVTRATESSFEPTRLRRSYDAHASAGFFDKGWYENRSVR